MKNQKAMSALINPGKMKKAVSIFLAAAPLALLAQTASTSASTAAVGQNDSIWYLIIATMAVLLFAILILGNILINLARLTMQKNKAKVVALILLFFVSGSLFAQDATPASVTASAGSALSVNWNLIMAGCVFVAELFAIIVLLLRIRAMIDDLSDKKVEKKPAFEIHLPGIFDNINASVAVEKEQDILLEHNYDGIRELDNNLPPWWKYSFYLSILFAICYFSYYHLLGGPSSRDEYEDSVKQAKEQQEEYSRLNAGRVDENTVTLADAAGIDEGKTIFTDNCVTCHGHLGEGIFGPNLTDDYWLHGGDLSDLFKSVKNGWPAKGMKAWQTDLSPVQIKNVVSYIKTLHGTNPPNAKAPQGDLISDDKAAKTIVDSTVTKSI
ncbi:MAG: c-type cytochrome [Bacteroidota bacterium]|nr:c-type cytochrome [Bacteroidota bacterium]